MMKQRAITRQIGNDWKRNPYYDFAASKENLKVFWGEESVFRQRFNALDCSYIIELACGHGRHVPFYQDRAKEIYLMDINQENIDFCKQTFPGGNIYYLVNSGSDFNRIIDNSISAIFCYDAMVHFDLRDVASYLSDAYRVLSPGGKILFHHSNNDRRPLNLYSQNVHSRNFMSRDIFANLAFTAGFNILSQDIINWGAGDNLAEKLDCLSLCQKPAH